MNDLRKAAQLALDALENHTAIKHPQQRYYRDEAIEALRAALQDEGKQEPVAWLGFHVHRGRPEFSYDKPTPSVMRDFNMRPLVYGDVPTLQRPLLTDDEVLDAVRDCGLDWHAGYDLDERNRYEMLARAIERKVRGEE